MSEVKRSIEIPFAIGEEVWRIQSSNDTKWKTCPECVGTCSITMIKGNGEKVKVPCATCAISWDPPIGQVKTQEYNYSPIPHVCQEVSISDGKFIYDGYYANDLYRTKAEAMLACAKKLKEHEDYMKECLVRNISSKRKDLANSVHYWSRKVKDLERDLILAKERLGLSKEKAKCDL